MAAQRAALQVLKGKGNEVPLWLRPVQLSRSQDMGLSSGGLVKKAVAQNHWMKQLCFCCYKPFGLNGQRTST